MIQPSSSPDRHTFQKQQYILRAIADGKSLDNPQVAAMIAWYDSWKELDQKRLQDPEWCENNLEWDLRTTEWIVEKVRINKIYAQNLYAALCNNDFANHIFSVLKEDYWSCSWRSAGGIVADMRGEGDYMDWYCSGIRGGMSYDPDPDYELNDEDYASEGHVTDEIRQDLERLGWIVIFNKE